MKIAPAVVLNNSTLAEHAEPVMKQILLTWKSSLSTTFPWCAALRQRSAAAVGQSRS
jgi:hypothetical protein